MVEGHVEAGVEKRFDVRHPKERRGGGREQDDGVGALATDCAGEGFGGRREGAGGEL